MSESPTSLPTGIAAIILAAGRSSRMGKLKALLPFPRKPLIVVQAENLLAAGVTRVYCVLGAEAAAIRPVVERLEGVEAVLNEEWQLGMFSSIKTGLLAASEFEGVFLQPVDVPPASIATLSRLASAGVEGAAVPVYAGRGGHPLFFCVAVARQIAAYRSDDRLDRILRTDLALHVRRIEIPDADCLKNLNRPEDWQEWQRTLSDLPGNE